MNDVERYARDVAAGTLPAGKYHRLACVRHLTDLERSAAGEFAYQFDYAAADRFFRFAAQLKHYKGKQFAGKPITLTPVQQFRLGSIFGWRHKATGLRRFTTSYNELPRKSGKTLEAAVVGLYVTFFEGEPGAEGYCIATKKQQAKLVFDAARKLVKSSGLSSRIEVFAHNLHRESSESKFEALGADADSTDGLNPYLIVTDEFHAHKTRDLVDVMESATGARNSFLHFQITTAGDDPVSPCGDQHDYACKILDGVLPEDESTVAFFAFIAHADPEDNWLDERTWIKANPHWGISVNPEDMRKLAAKAKAMPSAAAEFKQKRLNLWVNATAPCLSVDGWRQGQGAWTEADMHHESCYVGVDLASKIDLCSMSLVFPPAPGRPEWRVIQRIWTPKDTLKDRAHRDRAPYGVWVEQGWMRAVDGTSIDHDLVRQELVALREMFDIEQIGFDPWHADAPIKNLINIDGFTPEEVIAVPQTFAGMSSACLQVQADALAGMVDARGCPVTARSVANTVGGRDGKDNLMFVKGKSRGRIDPVISMTIGVALAIRRPVMPDSVYLTRGVVTLGE